MPDCRFSPLRIAPHGALYKSAVAGYTNPQQNMAMLYCQHILPNGLNVIAEVNPHAHSTAIGVFVQAGSRDEAREINGVSHFLEHMAFKGSEKYTWQDVNRIFDEMGARYNAFTTREMTAYYVNVLPEFTARAVEHLAHLLRPALRPEDFEMERNVILEEIAMCMDDPEHRLYEAAMAAHFADHPLAMSVLGTPESIRNLQRQQMADYFASRYGPGNMVLVVTGRVDFPAFIELAARHFSNGQTVDVRRDRPAPSFDHRTRSLADSRLNRQYTMALMPAPSAQDDRRFAASVLSDVIGDSEGSRLYWALVDNAIAEEADFDYYPHDSCGSYVLSLVTNPDRAREALDIALRELRRVRDDLKDDEIDRAKNKVAAEIVLQGEVPLGRMRAIGAQWIYNRQYRSLEQDLATLNTINADSLRRLMSDFDFSPMTVVTLGPDGNIRQ